MNDWAALVLAAGQGSRFESRVPKVLHPLLGRPLFEYAVRAALDAGAAELVVVANSGNAEALAAALHARYSHVKASVAVQERPLGSGNAAYIGCSATALAQVLVLCADTPLLDQHELAALHAKCSEDPNTALALLTVELDDPSGQIRVRRDGASAIVGLSEERDLSSQEERDIREVSANAFAARREPLLAALGSLRPHPATGECTLENAVSVLASSSSIVSVRGRPESVLGVDDRTELEVVERALLGRIRERHRRAGVTVHGDARIDDTVRLDLDVTLEASIALRGETTVAAGASIDAGSVITDSAIGERAVIKPYCVITKSRVEAGAEIGPFAHLRPNSVVGEGAHVGNFVETKQTRLGPGAKANHLAYLGDGDIGERANIGAGTIFCNYDGYRKHKTIIEAEAFIGSDSQLVAPVTVGRGAYVGTGTTVTEDVPADALCIGRTRAQIKPGYAPKLRAKKKATAAR